MSTEIGDRNKYIRRGALVTWCDSCQAFVDIPIEYDGHCPRCGELTIRRKCIRCEYEWWPSDPQRYATACPACKSPFYNRRKSIKHSGTAKRRAKRPAADAGSIPGLEEGRR